MGDRSPFSSLTIGLIVVGLIVGAGGGYFTASSSMRPRIRDLEGQVASLTSQVNELPTDLNRLENEKNDLESQVSTLDDQIAGLQSQISYLNSQISDLESELEDAQETMSQRDDTISALGLSIGEKNAIIDEKDVDISELESTIAEYENLIEALGAQIDLSVETNTLLATNSWLYLLQDIDLLAVGETSFDLVVIDYSQDGDEETRFTSDEISDLKDSPGGSKIVLAYMSIGEAEDYRWYWRDAWDRDRDGIPDSGAPSWLGPSNPDWVGNYKVRYWDEAWQSLIYGSADSYLDKIISSGFDGVYLDIIDAYEYWGPEGESGMERASAPDEMVDFVLSLAEYARVVKGVDDFLIFPQNGEALATYSEYVQVVSGIGKEDTWYDDDAPQPDSYSVEVIDYLDVFSQAGKLVLVVDYVTEADLIDSFYILAESNGYVPYSTVRDLDRITINSGHRPD
jgi:cysteinyl-tRNA synthetase